MKILLILGVILISVMIFLFGSVAYASHDIEGLSQILSAGVDGLESFFDFLIDVLELVAEHYWG